MNSNDSIDSNFFSVDYNIIFQKKKKENYLKGLNYCYVLGIGFFFINIINEINDIPNL